MDSHHARKKERKTPPRAYPDEIVLLKLQAKALHPPGYTTSSPGLES